MGERVGKGGSGTVLLDGEEGSSQGSLLSWKRSRAMLHRSHIEHISPHGDSKISGLRKNATISINFQLFFFLHQALFLMIFFGKGK